MPGHRSPVRAVCGWTVPRAPTRRLPALHRTPPPLPPADTCRT